MDTGKSALDLLAAVSVQKVASEHPSPEIVNHSQPEFYTSTNNQLIRPESQQTAAQKSTSAVSLDSDVEVSDESIDVGYDDSVDDFTCSGESPAPRVLLFVCVSELSSVPV